MSLRQKVDQLFVKLSQELIVDEFDFLILHYNNGLLEVVQNLFELILLFKIGCKLDKQVIDGATLHFEEGVANQRAHAHIEKAHQGCEYTIKDQHFKSFANSRRIENEYEPTRASNNSSVFAVHPVHLSHEETNQVVDHFLVLGVGLTLEVVDS